MANKLVTTEFKLHQIRQFVESITEPANTIYYAFAGKPTQYLLGDNTIDAPNTDIESLTTRVYDEMVLAKKVTSNDVKALVQRHNWTTGTVYNMYDSLDKNLKDKAFFVLSKEGGTYYVFKCLYNKEGANSTSQPIFSATAADDSYYETADGYVWKYMYQIDETTFNKFATIDYIPVIPDANVSANAINGEIDVIKIVSGGRDYNNYLSGTFTASDVRFNGVSTQYRITSSNAASNTNFYEGCILKITSGDGIGQYRKITQYSQVNGYYVAIIDEPFTTTPTTSDFEISPEITITGDGRQTVNAEARALINSTASNSVYKIEILNKGKEYFLASANVYANPIAKTTNTINAANLRVIYSPKGGHGYDAESELFATRMGISVKFSNNENGEISTDNDFRTIGLLKDPKFKDVKLQYDTLVGSGFSDTEQVIQAKLNRINGTVGVSTTSKNIFSIGTLTAIQVTAAGNVTFSNTDIITVSNVVINATANAVTNATGYLSSLPLVSAGYGISDTSTPVITSANATGGNVRYFDSRIITGLTASANGLAYTNADYIQISSTSAVVNAIAVLSTNSTGGILDVTITNSGKGFACNEIAYLSIDDGGSGYDSTSCNQIAFTGGGGTGAVATYANDGSGIITSVTLVSRGIGYTSVPTATPGGGGSSAVITPVLQANGLSIKVANSSGGYSNGAKVIQTITNANGDIDLYSNTDLLVFVSPSSSHGNAVANIETNADGSLNFANVNAGNNFGFNIGNTNLDYYVANATGGFVRRFDSKIVSNVVVSNSAPHYKVSSISIDTAGADYDATKVLRVDIVDGGIGYNSTANNILIFTSGTGSGANATFANDSSGKIITVTMVANGTGYLTSPTVTANAQANGIGANLVAVLANSITFTSTVGGYGAVAYFANGASGDVTSISIVNSGFGYTTAPTATISDDTGAGVDLTVSIDGGANCFATNDLFVAFGGTANASGNATANATYFLQSVDVTDSGGGFDTTNIRLKATNATSGNTRYFNGTIIKEITVSSGGFEQFGSNTDVIYVTNGNINAVGNAVTNATGGLDTVNLTISGQGFVNTSSLNMYAVNSTGGDVRYFNTNVVSSVGISDGGTGYSNTDYIIITSSGGIPARANIETTVSGTIVSTQLSNRGQGIVPWYVSEIEIISGGTGYSNADTIDFCGGGGTGAEAALLTNSSGGIVRVYVVNGGENYDCAPEVEVANTTGGAANGTSANLVAKLTKPTTLRVYNANGNPSIGQFADLTLTVKASPTLVANLVYAPTIGNTTELVILSTPASLEVQVDESANLFFTTTQAANLSLIIGDNRTTFDSSISAGDQIYLQTTSQSQVLTVEEVSNSTWLTVTEFPAFTNTAVAISVAKVNAKGNVQDRGANYINVSNVTGFFVQSNDIIGVSSRSYANVLDVSFNGMSKTGTNVDQLFTYFIASGDVSLFDEDEILTGANGGSAYFHSGNSTCIRVVRPNGVFLAGDTVTGEDTENYVVLDSASTYKYEGDFMRGSGDIIYIENIEPIARSNTQSETIKLILEF